MTDELGMGPNATSNLFSICHNVAAMKLKSAGNLSVSNYNRR